MRTKMKAVPPDRKLARILLALEQELIEASDEDIMEAAGDLGMNPKMKGSAAFLGVRFSAKMRVADFFEDVSPAKRIGKGSPGKEPADH